MEEKLETMEEKTEAEEKSDKEKKKMKNLISLVILLAGLFFGSLFVDIGQVVRGNGYSTKNLNKSDIFEAGGKTWVAYTEPAVAVSVINDENCEKCDVSEALIWFRKVLPTVAAEKVDFDSEEGKRLIGQFELKTLPAFIFSPSIEKTNFYSQAQILFRPEDEQYVLNTQELGLPAGKYLELPKVNENDAVFGNADAKVKVVIFSDFQCPYCKVFYSTLRPIMNEYQDRVQFAFKELPLEIHPQAVNASLAGECAREQEKFWEYADRLYATQSEWGATENATTTLFKNYARTLGLKADDFNKCMDDKKYQSKIETDKNEALSFGIFGTPAIFVGDQFENGAITAEQLKADIEEQLKKSL